jgi:hypothetical protein
MSKGTIIELNIQAVHFYSTDTDLVHAQRNVFSYEKSFWLSIIFNTDRWSSGSLWLSYLELTLVPRSLRLDAQ